MLWRRLRGRVRSVLEGSQAEKRRRTERSSGNLDRAEILLPFSLKVPSSDAPSDDGVRESSSDRKRPSVDEKGEGCAPAGELWRRGRLGEEGSYEADEGEGDHHRDEGE